jgi:hypothetical protein
VSSLSLYTQYVGHTFPLVEDCEVRDDGPVLPSYHILAPAGSPSSSTKVLGKLPKGTFVTVEAVRRETFIMMTSTWGTNDFAVVSLDDPRDACKRIKAEMRLAYVGLEQYPDRSGLLELPIPEEIRW